MQNSVDSFDLFFFFSSSYILFWPSIIWIIYNHLQKLSRNKLCSLSLSILCHLLSSHAILCAAYSQCNVKTTPIQNAIYTSTIDQAILLSMLSLFYTQDQAILLINAVSYLYKSIQTVYHLYKFKTSLITCINVNKQ
ncbi:hypothetical protein PS15m_012289 [Mucor circinelloides]